MAPMNPVSRLRLAQVSSATLAVALAVAAASPVAAQTKPAADAAVNEEAEAIVVQGFRASLESAVAAKRLSNNIVDVIKADDIASMPDANLAESIQRIPGVSIQRDAGEGRNVTVRGLGGDFVRTTLNGIEAFSATTGSTLGVVAGINRTRGFDFSTFASELFNAITVSKSQSAEMDEGSLAATIDLQTAKPFDKPGFRAAISAQGAYYDNNRTAAPRLAGLLSNTWGDFGVLVSAAYSKRKAQEDGYSDTSQSDYSDALNGFCGTAADIASQAGSQVVNTAIPFVNPLAGTGNRPANQCFSGRPSDATAYAAINQPNVFLPRNPGLGRFNLDQERIGLTGAIQYQPSDATHITIDGVFSQFRQDRTDYALSLASNNRNVNGASAAFPLFAGRVDSQIMEVNVLPTGQVDYMKLNNVDIKHIQERTKSTTRTYELALHLEQTLTDRLSFDGKVGFAGSDYNQPYTVLMSYDGFNKDGYVWDSREDPRRPFINYGYDVTNVNNVTFTNAGTGLTPDIRITRARVKNYMKTAAGNFKFELNDQFTLKAGVMYKDFTFRSEQTQRLFGNNGPPCTVSSTNTNAAACTAAGAYPTFNFAQFAADFPTLGGLSETLTGFGNQLGLPAGSVTSWVVPNVAAYIDKLNLLCNCANKYGDFTLAINSALGNNRSVSEKDLSFYGQTDFDIDLGGHALRGNFGLRYVRTRVASTGFTSLTSQITVPNSYTDLLPSANVSYEIRSDLLLRGAFAKVMARPGLGSLNPGGSLNTNFGAQSAAIGNPLLAPYRAKNYDLSLEWYPRRGMFYAVTLFYKDVGSTIQSLAAQEPFGNTGLPVSLLPTGQDASTIYIVTRFRNTSGGYIKGLELSMQQPLDFLPGPLSHLGVAANYTYVKSRVLYFLSSGLTATTTRDQFINVSPHSVNATVFYDDDKFSARVSVAYRDAYLTALPFRAEVPDGNYSYATTNVDAALSYRLTPRLQLTADLLNLTNQASDQFSGAVRQSQRVFSTTGRQFFVGASYTF
ncbi:TonB-dependent receptor [Novosphingobium piscinae]|uniref:TonB-dependent receptor n=2 Tax=Novosphingobium piscinae TaxID=1507448 RepID=A0A7X1FVA8_9SPHN|nr:TonB-dependent receptor [Novosphingobium piscinae]